MKKITTLLAIMALAFSTHAQSVEQGSSIIDMTFRLGIFNTHTVDKGNNNAQSNGRAGYLQYILGFHYCSTDRFTFGCQLRYNHFVIGKDTTKNQSQINVAFGSDLCADAAFHFVRSEHTDIYIGGALGGSYLHLANTNINSGGTYNAFGLCYNIDLGARFYLGDHFGIGLMLGYSGYSYPNGKATNDINGTTDHLKLNLSGSTYGIGICYKLG